MVKDLWPDRPIFTDDHGDYRRTVAEWVKRDVQPYLLEWESAEIIPREPWLSAGKQGLLGIGVDGADGGPGIDDHVYRLVFAEEMARVRREQPGQRDGRAQRHRAALPDRSG